MLANEKIDPAILKKKAAYNWNVALLVLLSTTCFVV